MKSLVPVDTWFCHNTPQSIIDSFLNKQTWLHWINWVILKAVTNLSTNRTSKVFFYIYFLHHTHTLGMQIKIVFTVKPPPPFPHAVITQTYTQEDSEPLPWASVHWLVQCTLECHWNVTGWPSVHWNTTGWPSEYLQGTLEHHWKNLVETAPHWNATGEN